MASQTATLLMNGVELSLWTALCLLFWRKGLHGRFPALATFLGVHVAFAPLQLLHLCGPFLHWFDPLSAASYGALRWLVGMVSTVLVYFVCLEVFRSVLSGYTGLMHVGILLFRWVSVASVIASFTSLAAVFRGQALIPTLADAVVRSGCIIGLCLLAFICLSMDLLHLPVRDAAFGVSVGLGILSAKDLVQLFFANSPFYFGMPLAFYGQAVLLAVLAGWAVFFALPEPARKPAVVLASSAIYRWNEIASALGHCGTKVVVRHQANSFVFTDTEVLVEQLLTRAAKGREAES